MEMYQILVGHAPQFNRLDAQILEALGVLVELLVNELPLNLIAGRGRPPDEAVESLGNWLHQLLGDVNVSPVLDDLLVDKFGELSHRVFARAVQLVGLGSRGVVVEHLLESHTNIDGVNRPEALLHPVGGNEVGDTGKPVQETVLETEHGGGANDGSLGVDAASNLLTLGLGAVEFGWRVEESAVRRDMNIAINVVLGHGFGNALGSFNVDVLEGEVPNQCQKATLGSAATGSLGGIIPSDQVVHNVGVTDALLDGCGIAEVVFLARSACMLLKSSASNSYNENNPAQVSSNLEVALRHFLAERNHDRDSRAGYQAICQRNSARNSLFPHTQSVDDVTAQESGGTEDGRSIACVRR